MARRWIAAAGAALVSLALGAAAPAPASYNEQIPDLVSALIVKGVAPGPAWWKVTRGDSTLWILGAPPYLSPKYQWDQRALARRLNGANGFLLPLFLLAQPVPVGRPAASTAAAPAFAALPGQVRFQAPPPPRGLVQTEDGVAPPGRQVADLPPDLHARLDAALARYGQSPSTPTLNIVAATRNLDAAMFRQIPLDERELRTQLQAAAVAAKIRPMTLPLTTIPESTDYTNGPVSAHIDCLAATLDLAESGPEPLKASLDAWAVGDLPNALAGLGCVGAKGRVYRSEVGATMTVLQHLLTWPGRSVAVVELVPLLMKDGIIEQLRAAGYTVEAPDSALDDAGDELESEPPASGGGN